MRKSLIFLSLIAVFLTTAKNVWAHPQGGPPYLSVNGEYAETAPVLSSKMTVAQDLVKNDLVAGSSAHFAVDSSRLTIPVTVLGYSIWRWNFGGNYEDGQDLTHKFTKTGSYIVTLQLKNPAYNRNFQDYDLVQVNVAPKSSYVLPSVVVTATANRNDKGNLVVKFTTQVNVDPTTKASDVKWDFGDQQEATGEEVQHEYQTFPQQEMVTVRVVDENGLFNDSSWKLDTDGNLTRVGENYASKNIGNVAASWWIVILTGGLILTLIGGGVTIWKLRRS